MYSGLACHSGSNRLRASFRTGTLGVVVTTIAVLNPGIENWVAALKSNLNVSALLSLLEIP